MVIVGTEDVPEFVIQMVLLAATGDGALDVIFWVSLVGTVFHSVLNAYDSYIDYCALEVTP